MMWHRFRYGPLVFRDPLLLCGALYVLLYSDASGFLRLGLLAAFLHEWGHKHIRQDRPGLDDEAGQ